MKRGEDTSPKLLLRRASERHTQSDQVSVFLANVLDCKRQACEAPHQNSVFFGCVISDDFDHEFRIPGFEDAVAILTSIRLQRQAQLA